MNLERISSIIPKLHPGASYVVVYEAKAWLADGVTEIKKVVKRPVRLGIRYAHVGNVPDFKPKPLPGNGRWVIDRFVYEDNKGYKLRVTNGAFGKSVSHYYDGETEISSDKCWHSAKKPPIVQSLKLENVIAILRKGEEL